MDLTCLVRHAHVDFDEDASHELKAHRSFDSEDINPNFPDAIRGRHKRSSVSRYDNFIQRFVQIKKLLSRSLRTLAAGRLPTAARGATGPF
jgi:hypothetical protein